MIEFELLHANELINLHINSLYTLETTLAQLHNMNQSKRDLTKLVLQGTRRWLEAMEASLSDNGHIRGNLVKRRGGQLHILGAVLDMHEVDPGEVLTQETHRQEVKSTLKCAMCQDNLHTSKLSSKHQLVKCNHCNIEVHKKCMNLAQSCICQINEN